VRRFLGYPAVTPWLRYDGGCGTTRSEPDDPECPVFLDAAARLSPGGLTERLRAGWAELEGEVEFR
jgi:hypothetical protein